MFSSAITTFRWLLRHLQGRPGSFSLVRPSCKARQPAGNHLLFARSTSRLLRPSNRNLTENWACANHLTWVLRRTWSKTAWRHLEKTKTKVLSGKSFNRSLAPILTTWWRHHLQEPILTKKEFNGWAQAACQTSSPSYQGPCQAWYTTSSMEPPPPRGRE